MAAPRKLRTALGTYGCTRPLKDGRVTVPGVELEFIEITPVHTAFRRMLQERAFDISEMSLTTFIAAKFYEKPIVALPVTVMRMFHHGSIWVRRDAGISTPKDLEGRRIGVRAYAQTGPIWSRGVLQAEYGVDLDRVTWVTFEGSHVPECLDPPSCKRAVAGKSLMGMLAAKEVDGALSLDNLTSDQVRPLFADAGGLAQAWHARTGIYPINHIVVVAKELAETRPEILRQLFDAFVASKRIFLENLAVHGPADAGDEIVVEQQRLVGGDPLPFGVAPNRPALEAITGFACQQHVVPCKYKPEELFDQSLLDLEG